MARIRTIKPEAFASESLATVSLAAERTFFGLLTQADDHGRFRDQPAVIAGLLWSLRPEHNPVDVDDDLNQLAAAHLICRFEGDDGKRYLHIVTWRQHQKINRPSGVRFPACPHHDVEQHSPDAPQTHGDGAESSMSTPGGLSEGSRTQQVLSDHHKTAAQSTFHEYSPSPHEGLSEPSASPHGPDLGPRNLDLGTTSPSGAQTPPHRRPSRPSSSWPSTPLRAPTARPAACSVTSDGRPPSSSQRASTPLTSARGWPDTGPRGSTRAPCPAWSTRL